MIEERSITSLGQLVKALDSLPNSFIYRGQADARWSLQSSLERMISKTWSSENVKKFEEFSLKKFKSKFKLYDRENSYPESKLSWLSAMQHYGVPTRLLDFTSSPYVALYFALENYNPLLGQDVSIYALNSKEYIEKSLSYMRKSNGDFLYSLNDLTDYQDSIFDEFIDPRSNDIVWITEPEVLNVRLDRQDGSFLMSGHRGVKIEDALNFDIYKDCTCIKYIIPKSLYRTIFVLLRKMNINSKSLYGDLEGLSKSISMEMLIYSFNFSNDDV